MKKYLSTIHQRSTAHKKRFALAVSGSITLIIFGLWSLIVFGDNSPKVVQTSDNSVVISNQTDNSNAVPTISPFDGIKDGVANVFSAIKNQVEQLTHTAGSINIQNKYNEARDQALSN